jgi:hypothetical protein
MAAKAPARPAKDSGKGRKLRRPKYTPLHVGKKLKVPVGRLPNVWLLTRKSALLLWQHKTLFAGITLIYGLLTLLLVQGIAGGTDVQGVKEALNSAIQGQFASVGVGLGTFVTLLSSAGNTSSNTAGAYQLILVLISSLAVIWALRQVLAGANIRIRDAYYRGMYPFVPFVLVLCVVGLQLLPMVVGTSLYSLVVTNGIAVHGVEQLLWGLLAVLLTALSLYWLCSSLFALYIVTLPDMTPMKALRSARELLRYRRLQVLRKLLWLPLVLFIAAAIIMLPIIIWLTPLAQWVFFILSMFALVAVHSYMYTLYRELLNE